VAETGATVEFHKTDVRHSAQVDGLGRVASSAELEGKVSSLQKLLVASQTEQKLARDSLATARKALESAETEKCGLSRQIEELTQEQARLRAELNSAQQSREKLISAESNRLAQMVPSGLLDSSIGQTVIWCAEAAAKGDRVRDLGADHVILYGEQDVAAEVRRITGGAGVPVAYDSVGAATFEGTLASLSRRGVFVSFGNASGPPPAVEPGRLMRMGSLFLTRPTLGDYVATTEELDASAGAVFARIASGEIEIEIGQTFPLSQARAAHEALESRQTVGSTLLVP
jgi:Zn-dependent alcohol dehydrogenase